ncbi:MAG: phosphodiester glycosidase family protein [Solobacterium sp.]|nr:phosphodiester glycosidase family protein [Solobacterium sp.]
MKKLAKIAAVFCVGVVSIASRTRTVNAETIKKSWGQGSSNTFILGFNNAVGSAVNIYTMKDSDPSIIHHTGNYNGVNYEMLEVTPSETTFVKMDYIGRPDMLDAIYDWGLLSEGYVRAGGINANYYSWITNPNYGQPVGGLRMAGKWTYFHSHQNLPEYGSGFVTAYWDRFGPMKLVYHGQDVATGAGWVGEKVESECALSGSYTYLVDGERKDLTGGYGWYSYHSNDYGFTCLAQKKDGTFLLICFWNGMRDEKVQDFLLEQDAYNAIRLDGGTSTCMVYEDALVKEAA